MSPIGNALESLEPREKLLLALAAPLLILGAYFVVLLGPRLARTAELRAHVAALEQDPAAKSADAAAVPARRQELADVERRFRLVMEKLPDEKEIPQLLAAISTLGRAAGLEILVFRLKPESHHSFYAEVPVEMQMRGTFHEVAEFLDRVRELDRIVTVSDIALRNPKVVEDDLLLEASARVTTFRFLAEEERGKLVTEQGPEGPKR